MPKNKGIPIKRTKDAGKKKDVVAAITELGDKREQKRALRKARMAEKRALREEKLIGSKRKGRTVREKQIVAIRDAVSEHVQNQVLAGVKPNVTEAIEAVGLDPSNKELRKIAGTSIIAALDAAGITDERLVSKANQLLEAKHTKFFAHQGVVMDERDITDNKIQHDTWRDLMMVRGHLRTDLPSQVGGLMIVNAIQAIQDGHELNCQCDDCKAKWEARAADSLTAQRRRNSARLLDTAPELVATEVD